MDDHSRLAPSSAHVWVACTGQPRLVAGRPDTEATEASEEGDLAHAAGAELLRDGASGYDLDEEMREHVFAYAQTFTDLAAGNLIHIEDRQKPAPEVIHPEVWGTPDTWWYDSVKNTLNVGDLKYGHKAVEVAENWQLVTYAALIIERLRHELDAGVLLETKVALHIYQPRAYDSRPPLRSWLTSVIELRGPINMLFGAAHDGDTDRARLRVGDHCEYCPARVFCPALREASAHYADFAQTPDADDLDPARLGNELAYSERAFELLEFRVEALRAQGEAMMQRGDVIPGYEMQRSRGNVSWNEAQRQEILETAEILGLDIVKGTLKTPGQVRKLGMPDDLVDEYSTRKPGKLKLGRINLKQAKEVFSK